MAFYSSPDVQSGADQGFFSFFFRWGGRGGGTRRSWRKGNCMVPSESMEHAKNILQFQNLKLKLKTVTIEILLLLYTKSNNATRWKFMIRYTVQVPAKNVCKCYF